MDIKIIYLTNDTRRYAGINFGKNAADFWTPTTSLM